MVRFQTETVSSTDAMQFPLIGSCVLFGLYIVIKFVKKEASHVQAGLTCFGNWLAHYHIVIVVHGMPDAQAFRNDVDAWMRDCGFVAAAVAASAVIDDSMESMRVMMAALLLETHALETHASKQLRRND